MYITFTLKLTIVISIIAITILVSTMNQTVLL